jgi:hypothetical protein
MPTPDVPLEELLFKHYGQFIAATDVAFVLGFGNPNALVKAQRRDPAPLELFSLPGRRGLFTTPEMLGRYCRRLVAENAGHVAGSLSSASEALEETQMR